MSDASRISIAHIPVKGPNDYDGSSRAVGEDLAYWPCDDAPAGAVQLYFPLATESVVMGGDARIADGGDGIRVRVGDWLRVPGGSTLALDVAVPLVLRSHAPEARVLDHMLGQLAARLRERPALATGRFVPVTTPAHVTLPPATYVTALPRVGRPCEMMAHGPLFDALFALPAERIAPKPIVLADDATRLWDCNWAFSPVGLTWSPTRGAPPVVSQLRATGLEAFAALEAIRDNRKECEDEVGRVTSLLALDAAGALDAAETLVLQRDGAWWRWQSDPSGAPLAEALAPWLRPAAPSMLPPADFEPILERLLAGFWDGSTPAWMLAYMSSPDGVPWPVGGLACPFASRLSPAFRTRWSITHTCDGDASALPGDRGVIVRAVSATEWSVRWHYFHEHAEWLYTLTGPATHERELVSQYD